MNVLLGILCVVETLFYLCCFGIIARVLFLLIKQKTATLKAQEEFICSEIDRL